MGSIGELLKVLWQRDLKQTLSVCPEDKTQHEANSLGLQE